MSETTITEAMIEAAARALARQLEGEAKEESWWERYKYAARLALEAAAAAESS